MALLRNFVQITMKVARDHGVFPTHQQVLNLEKTVRVLVEPEGVVHEHERPAGIGVFGQCVLHVLDLMVGNNVATLARRIEREKQHVLVDE